MTTMTHWHLPVKPDRNLFDGDNDLVASTLPRLDGSGLTVLESFRLNGAVNRARAAYAQDCPVADSIELHRVSTMAAKDELLRLLKDRAPAPCCAPDEAEPCRSCGDSLPALASAWEPESADEDLLELALSSDPGRWIAGADSSMTPEDLEILAELNASNPSGAIECLDSWPSYTSWPAWCDNWIWGIAEAEREQLTLREFVQFEAERMRLRDNQLGDLLADRLVELHRDILTTSADHPGQVEERLSILSDHFTEEQRQPELSPIVEWL